MSREFFSKERWLRKQEEREGSSFVWHKSKINRAIDPYRKTSRWLARHRPPCRAYSIACYNTPRADYYIGAEPLKPGYIYSMSDFKDWDSFVTSNRNRILHYNGYGSSCWHRPDFDSFELFLTYEKLPYTESELKEAKPLYWRYDHDASGVSFAFLVPTDNPRHITSEAVRLFFHRGIISDHLKFESRKEIARMSGAMQEILQGI